MLLSISDESIFSQIIGQIQVFIPDVVLKEVSKLIGSVMSKRKGNQRKRNFLEKKRLYSMEMDLLRTLRNFTPTDGSCYEAVDSLILQEIFSYLKFHISSYLYNYTFALCHKNDSKSK